VAAVRAGRWCAVLDPSWPAPLRAAAEEAVARWADAGRAGPGDLVLFTSGSTGRPRAVVRTAASWDASTAGLSALTGIGAQDAVWLPGPLSSSLFLHGAWHAGAVGAEVLAQRGAPARATALHAVPALLERAVTAAEEGALPRLRCAVVAGDRLPEPLRRRARALGWRVVEYYGAAELSFVASRVDEEPLRAFPGADVAARDGVLWVRSPYLSRGYLDPGDDGPLRRDGAWATVGDLGAVRPDGSVDLRGRASAAVTTGGSTVVVEEVEHVLAAVDGVADVAVVGADDPRRGAVVVAVVVPALSTGRADLRTRLDEAARALPLAARPRRWYRAAALPRTAAGKLDRPVVAAAVASGSVDLLAEP